MNELEVNGKTNDIYTFDFSEMGEKAEEAQELDNDFCDNADEAVAHAKKALRSFKRLHDLMANHYQGTWRRWLGFRNITKDEAARMLRKYEYVVANGDNADYILQLAESKKRLVDEAARPSTPQELKDGVASGDITTLPQFKKLKAELEATKNVLRTTESKLTSAEQERDDEKRKNAELDSSRANIMKQNADYAQENHMLKMDNNALAHENEQLRNQPQAEPEIRVVEKRVEVIPDEYKKAFMENQRMRKELATYKAHSQGQTLQELAQIDKEYADLEKSYDEEEKACQRLEQFAMLPYFYPDGPIEARELVRCYMKFHGAEEAAVNSMIESIDHARDAMEWIGDALKNARKQMEKFDKALNRPALEVVK